MLGNHPGKPVYREAKRFAFPEKRTVEFSAVPPLCFKGFNLTAVLSLWKDRRDRDKLGWIEDMP
jgi:hypothetical protein